MEYMEKILFEWLSPILGTPYLETKIFSPKNQIEVRLYEFCFCFYP